MGTGRLLRFRLGAMFLPVALFSAGEPGSRADEPAAKTAPVGSRVVQKNREFLLRVGDAGKERMVPLDIWHVEKIDGARIHLRGEKFGIAGLALADELIAVDRAIVYFSDQIRDQPDHAFAFVMRTMLCRDKKELDQALTDCDEAVRIEPGYSVAYECRAGIWLDKEENEKAISDCESALKLDRQSTVALLRRGSALAQRRLR